MMNPLFALLALGVAIYAWGRKSAAVATPALPVPSTTQNAIPKTTPEGAPPSLMTTELVRGTHSGKVWRLSTIRSGSSTVGDVGAPAAHWPDLAADVFVLRFHLTGNTRVLSHRSASVPDAMVQLAMKDFNVKPAA